MSKSETDREDDDVPESGAAFNAGDETQVRSRTDKAKGAEIRRANGLKNLMSTPDGRAWMWNLLSECAVFRTTFNPDAATAAYNEGQRKVGLSILAPLRQRCMSEYLLMEKENAE